MASSEAETPGQNADPPLEAVETQIRQLLLQTYDLEPERLTALRADEPLFGGGLGLDSLDSMTLVIALEDHFGQPLRNDATTRKAFSSLDSLAKHLCSLLS
jgi:acyl carrier protein